MNESRFSFLRQLIDSPSPSGFEQPIQQVIREELGHYTDEIRTDVHGNVIAALHSTTQPRVMLTAHCDEIGFLIRYIDEQGFLYFAPIGGFDTATLAADRILIQTPNGPITGVIGRKPIHMLHGEERNKLPDISEMWIDIGVANKEEAQKLVPLGSSVTRAAQLARLHGDLVVSKALDDRAGILPLSRQCAVFMSSKSPFRLVFFSYQRFRKRWDRVVRLRVLIVSPHLLPLP